MLVLGYQGTLRPACGSCGPAGLGADPGENEETLSEVLPPFLEAAAGDLTAGALLELSQRVPASQRLFGGEPVPLESLIGVLRQRLAGILTQAVAHRCESRDGSTAGDYQDVVREFPVLASLLRQAVADWTDAAAVFHGRLQRDAIRLAVWLGVEAVPPIEALTGTASDIHPGGQFVIRVAFAGGRCLYYKPRAMTGEWLWHRLLEAIAGAEPSLRLPAARVLGGGAGLYGWAESVVPEECLGPERMAERQDDSMDLPAYWRAAGAMLCLAQQVRLTDLHMGNLTATRMGPAVTDAECLGTPNLPLKGRASGAGGDAAIAACLDSLHETGLLPGNAASGMPDTSGLFGGAARVPGICLPAWASMPDGRYRMLPTPAALRDHRNAPTRTSPIAVVPQLMSGYRAAAEALIATRRGLLASGSVWRCVLEKTHAPRVVVRDTLTYGILLSRSLETQCLRSEHFRRNAMRGALAKTAPADIAAAVLRSELHALASLHVPRLVIQPDTRSLSTSSGRRLQCGYAACTPAEAVVRQIESLSADTLESVQIPALLLRVFHH